LPIELRHLLEVHAVDRGDDGRWHEDDRDYREELDDVVLSEIDAAERRVQQELHFLRLEARVLFHRLQIAQRRLYRLAHGLRPTFGTPFRHQEEQKALDRHHAFSQVRDFFVLAAERIERVGINLIALAPIALGPEDRARDPIEAFTGPAERACGSVEAGVDQAESHRARRQRLCRSLAELLRE
jgi:hypothetical protein